MRRRIAFAKPKVNRRECCPATLFAKSIVDSTTPGAAPMTSLRAAHVLHLAPPDAVRLARLVLPTLAAASGANQPGLRTLILTDDDDTAVAVARFAAREVGGGIVPIVALTSGARARRVLGAQVPMAAAIPVPVAAALLRQSALPLGDVHHEILAMPATTASASTREAIDAVMSELPKSASRTLVAARETPEVEALVDRHFFKARRIREEIAQALVTFKGSLQVVAASPGTRWDILRRLLDQIDPPAAVVLTPDAAAHAEAERELAALGYTAGGPVIASRDAVEQGTSMVLLLGVPDAVTLAVAAAAAPPHLVVLCAPTEIAEIRAIAGAIPVRVVALDGPQARATSREATTRARLREILASGEFGRELATLAPLLDEFDGSEVAAAALVMAAEAARKPAQVMALASPPVQPAREARREPRTDRGSAQNATPRRGPPRGPSREPTQRDHPGGDRSTKSRDYGGIDKRK
jgi:hypothetical protein